ncbi:MAG: UDP-N-acetylglucosamine 1-carboxyvinyltransferase, partial [Gaiellaceae bacterium]
KLVNLGARIILCDPHRVVVTGPARLYGERMSSPDIRAGMAMLLAALCAEGTSTIGNVREIDRGYERIDERLRALGARIERVEG